MFSGIHLSDILTQWRDCLVSSQVLESFCQTKYGKSLKLFIGLDPNVQLTETDCPYIIIYPGWKTEGGERKQFCYMVPVHWAIINSSKTISGNQVELDGIYDCDMLGQLILAELAEASPGNPISYVKYEMQTKESLKELAYFPKFEGKMEVKFYITPVLGGNITY